MFHEKFINDDIQSNIEEIEIDEIVSYINKKRLHLDMESY